MTGMNTARHDTPRHGTRPTTSTSSAAARPEQLTLLAPTEMPLQFRLDEQTRRRGLAHIARIRLQLELQAAQRAASIAPTRRRPATATQERRTAA